MFHQEKDTLDLLGKYSQKDYKEEKPQKEKIIYRTVGQFNTKESGSFLNTKLFFIGIGILIMFFIFMQNGKSPTLSNNPILGTWRTNTLMGIMEIKFKSDSMEVLGEKSKVKYEINGNTITVFDTNLNIGTTFKIMNKNTIYSEFMSFKSYYKKVD